MSAALPFVQFEFSHHIGPEAGRYVVRDGDDDDVLVIGVEGAERPRTRLFKARAKAVSPREETPELSVTVVTVILATRKPASAQQWLDGVRESAEEQERWIAEALAIVNRAVAAYRACAADPYATDLSRGDPRAVRIGYGPAPDLIRGGWDAALAVPPPAGPRLDRALRLMPTEGMAAVLAGRARTLESEELLLRVVLDLEHGRFRAAAVGLRAAGELLEAELPDELRVSRDVVNELAARAIAGPLSADDQQRLGELAEAAGAQVDAWRYVPAGAE